MVVSLSCLLSAVNAPKKDIELDKYLNQSYETLFEREIDRRKNQRSALNEKINQQQTLTHYHDKNSSSASSFQFCFQ